MLKYKMDFVKKQYKRFKHPFTCKVAGPSGCGKTELVKKIIANFTETIFFKNDSPDVLKIIWAYGVEGAVRYEQYHKCEITYIEGLPSIEELKDCHLLVIDDLMQQLANSSEISTLFTRGRHLEISTIFIVQNALPQGREMRNVTLNTHYVILFDNPGDSGQITILAGRFYPKKRNFFLDSFEDALKTPYGYIRRDNTADTPNKYRLQTNIIPVNGELVTTCYMPKNV